MANISQSRLSLLEKQDFFIHPTAGGITCEIIGNCVVLRGARNIIQNQKDQISNYLAHIEEVHLDLKRFFGSLSIRMGNINKAPQMIQIHVEKCGKHFPKSDCLLLTYQKTLTSVEAIKLLCSLLQLNMKDAL